MVRNRGVRLLSRVAFAALCAVVAGIVVLLVVLPRTTGGAALTVLTGSMTPDIPVGSVVLIRPVDPQTLRVGDVATYQVSPESRALVTHRVIDVRGSGAATEYVFKGDANRGADSRPVPAAAVRGEVWFHVPLLGSLRDSVQGMNLVVLLAPPLLLLYAGWLLVGGARDRRRTTPAGPAGPTVERPLLAARFRHRDLDGIGGSPEELALRWGGLLLSRDEETLTVLLAPDPADADEVRLLVGAMGPEAVWTCDDLASCSWRSQQVAAPARPEATDVPA